ncbi:hypothetical protein [Sphingomonas jatrophae]|uniref:hypothetical protein n=1 Tax=Sphingomonas jatrophae TaxID=1166337 RepID=UPI001042376F|nr:hypothetical protein [Sphingomonas jatrophae]
MSVTIRHAAAALTLAVLPLQPVLAASGLPRVTAVTIQRNGARSAAVSGDESAAYCRRFRLTPAEVRGYFRDADPVDQQAYVHDLDMSRCHAAGTVRLADGRRGRWTIDLARRGMLTIAGRPARYFYCLSCRSPKFDEVDAETADTARDLIRRARKAR